MVFWLLQYLAQRPGPDFNNGSGDNSNCGCILGPQHLFEFDLNNDPSQVIPVLGQMEVLLFTWTCGLRKF